MKLSDIFWTTLLTNSYFSLKKKVKSIESTTERKPTNQNSDSSLFLGFLFLIVIVVIAVYLCGMTYDFLRDTIARSNNRNLYEYNYDPFNGFGFFVFIIIILFYSVLFSIPLAFYLRYTVQKEEREKKAKLEKQKNIERERAINYQKYLAKKKEEEAAALEKRRQAKNPENLQKNKSKIEALEEELKNTKDAINSLNDKANSINSRILRLKCESSYPDEYEDPPYLVEEINEIWNTESFPQDELCPVDVINNLNSHNIFSLKPDRRLSLVEINIEHDKMQISNDIYTPLWLKDRLAEIICGLSLIGKEFILYKSDFVSSKAKGRKAQLINIYKIYKNANSDDKEGLKRIKESLDSIIQSCQISLPKLPCDLFPNPEGNPLMIALSIMKYLEEWSEKLNLEIRLPKYQFSEYDLNRMLNLTQPICLKNIDYIIVLLECIAQGWIPCIVPIIDSNILYRPKVAAQNEIWKSFLYYDDYVIIDDKKIEKPQISYSSHSGLTYVTGHYRSGHWRNGSYVSGGWVKGHFR